ncbi:CcoQ/FixQ family Cbb3-type cytochrome c oxidase assembly chaperone [Capnocytophaga sp.]|uniref:CcoQ/FixQ family Cbb3-type cytochrome c oxidase assembly chaperone n=1 Tax=Capnocytophaga sp. TaxID=44737 RepID=UPI0026DC5785|nr:CcoQ/FixQ family Cbb3-type cytochrome c oxidase assembly chaperone [Capnocytophaga sp.]MDO5104806.1 CcoQ/FixQ family Cbb3-type cytochrome c oxidase assembly chaperone [Capnocytophaga sp.]
MIKSIKEIMASSDGFEIFPIISLLIFFLFFVGLFWWVLGYKKESINELNNIPFDDDDENNTLL